ncbi:MAG TPA: acetylxylan esterase, partial [Longimicrobiales bacterium]
MSRLDTRRRAPRAALFTAALLCLAAQAAAQQLTFTPFHANGIYTVGEKAGWTVTPAAGDRTAAGAYSYTVKRDGLSVVKTGTFELSSGKATIETSLAHPGMVLVEVKPPAGVTGFHGASKAEVGRALLGAAVAPTRIRPSYARPADFDAFWTAKIAQLQKIPVEPVLTPGESGTPGVEWSSIRMNNINGAHVWGQLAKPAREGKFPALLILQWASPPYPLQKVWVTSRAAEGWLVLNVEPHDVPADMPQAFYDALPTMIKNDTSIGLHSRDENYFLPMYLGDYRAAEYLASRPDWDGKTLVVMGTSMGGQQSWAVAGLHPKISAMLVEVPAGADLLGPLTGRKEPYPNWDVKNPEIRALAPYFDG